MRTHNVILRKTTNWQSERKPNMIFENFKGNCTRHGSELHKANMCKFKNEFCRLCYEIGRIVRVCLS